MHANTNRQRHTTNGPVELEMPRVLVVDPDDGVRQTYREALARDGYEVLEAVDGREALTKALVRVPALVVTELRLPFVDGIALCEILRRDRTTAGVPLVIITTETQPEALARARLVADTVLAKPAAADAVRAECARLTASGDPADGMSGGAGAHAPAPARSTDPNRAVLAKSLPRFTTTTPPATPPTLSCPACDRALKYDQSHIGGVSERHQEQWDYYTCGNCGTFQYRQRTRRIRRVE